MTAVNRAFAKNLGVTFLRRAYYNYIEPTIFAEDSDGNDTYKREQTQDHALAARYERF